MNTVTQAFSTQAFATINGARRWAMAAALFAVSAIPATLVQAGDAPDVLIKRTTSEVLAEFDTRRDELKGDNAKLYQLVSDKILPHMDFKRMSRMVLGRNWKKATTEQQGAFTEEFKTLLVRTYASALFEYTGQPIEYLPFRLAEGDEDAVVKTAIDPGSGPKIPLSYSLVRNDSGDWQLYDVSIDGISLVTNYRSSYTRQIKRGGIDGLIAQIKKKNGEFGS